MSTCEDKKIITAEELEVLQQKAQKAMGYLRQSFTSSLEYIDTITADLIANSKINVTERPLYLDSDKELGYLVHDWSSLEQPGSPWSQNTDVTAWLQDILDYKKGLATYRDQYNKTQ